MLGMFINKSEERTHRGFVEFLELLRDYHALSHLTSAGPEIRKNNKIRSSAVRDSNSYGDCGSVDATFFHLYFSGVTFSHHVSRSVKNEVAGFPSRKKNDLENLHRTLSPCG